MKKVEKDLSHSPERPMPEITPEMIRTTFEALEAKGMVHYTEQGVFIPTEKGWKLLMEIKPVKEEIVAYGHPNITANHPTTFEITKDEEIGKDADCIIGVKANKSCKDLSEELKSGLRSGRKIEITIEVEGMEEKIVAYGSPALELSDEKDIVVRKSDFIDGRTLCILADKAAKDLNKEIRKKLRDPNAQIKIIIEVK